MKKSVEMKYVLDEDGNVRREPDLMVWARWFESAKNRIVKQDTIGNVRISTVFLGLDHSFVDDEPPVLWETMVFGGEHDHDMDRCSGTREQAQAMHEKMLAKIRQK
jgi:hypothetical protein